MGKGNQKKETGESNYGKGELILSQNGERELAERKERWGRELRGERKG